MSHQTFDLTCGQPDEELLTSMELASFARRRRSKSDPLQSKATCAETDSEEIEEDDDMLNENALNEDGLSDSDLEEEHLHDRRDRPRIDTHDYGSDQAFASKCYVTPANSQQIAPTLSSQVPAGVVTATPSNPIMFFYCALPPQVPGAFNMPFQYCGPMPSMNSNYGQMPSMSSMVSQASLEVPTDSSASSSGNGRSTSPVNNLAVPPKSPPGAFGCGPTLLTSTASLTTGRKNPPGCWGAADATSKSTVTPVQSTKQMDTERTKRNQRQNVKQTESARTTVMLRNLPSYFSRDMVLELLDSLGFAKRYDFVHMPADLIRLSCLGFAFVNFRTHEDALQFFSDAHGFGNWQRSSGKVLDISWSNPLQGLPAQIQRYRNATVMHPSVPEQCRPLLFGKDGERIPFPEPTIELRPPRNS